MRPPECPVLDRAVSRACIAQDRARLARAFKLARKLGGKLPAQARSWAAWVGYPAKLRASCPVCGEVVPLCRPAGEPDDATDDGAGPRCAPCWRSCWDYGRAHVPEAWLVGGEWPVQGSDGRWYAADAPEEESGPAWDTYRGAVEALTLPEPALVAAWVPVAVGAACSCCGASASEEDAGTVCHSCGGRGVVEVQYA